MLIRFNILTLLIMRFIKCLYQFFIVALLIICTYNVNAQISFDFEDDAITYPFEDFDGGMATVIDNPQMDAINSSDKVAQIVRDGGEIWAGSKLLLANNLDFTTDNVISMKVFSTAPIGTIIKMKLENNGTSVYELDRVTTKINEWETIEWDFTGQPNEFYYLVFMFDFGVTGDGSATSTFLFDDVEQLFGGFQIDWPVNWEDDLVNYSVTDFGGTSSTLVADPTNPSNNVIQTIKTNTAETWAGTTIGTNAGFATFIPLSLTSSKMSVRVWSPDAGIPVRLKVEDHSDPTHTCETETLTTVAEEWEILEFDFTNQAPGTESLSVGLSMGWVYNMASIFFNFDTPGSVAGEKIYYFDEVTFGDLVIGYNDFQLLDNVQVYPNPANEYWNFNFENSDNKLIEIFDVAGKLIANQMVEGTSVNVSVMEFAKGAYIAKISSDSQNGFVKLLKE